jgi:glycosyltransferase involved in cell wall biosynthesis
MKLSVAMIAYNHERYVAQAIESVLAQKTDFEYEIVIGEDFSTDGTRAVIMDLRRRHPGKIAPILRDRNIGPMRNFVETIGACRGRYVAFLEGDDYWTSVDKLQRQVDFLESHPDRVLCCHRVEVLNEAGPAELGILPARPAGTYEIEDLLGENFVMTGSAVLRRDSIGPFPDWLFAMKMGDWPLFAMAATRGRIELLDEVMAVYRIHPGGVWSSLPPIERLQEGERMLRALDEQLGFRYTAAIRRTIIRSYLVMASMARASGRRAQTARHLLRYLRGGGLRLRENGRLLAGLTAYILVGSGYRALLPEKTKGR